MALEDIFRALREQADQECKRILSDARDEAKVIIADAEAEAERVRRRIAENAESSLKRKALQRLNEARLESKREVTSIKGTAVEKVFNEAKTLLDGIRRSKDYEELLGGLVNEATGPLGDDVVLLVDPSDEKLAERLLAASGIHGTVRGEISCCGGVVATSADGRIHRRNTLEDRLLKARQLAQAQVAAVLFEEQGVA